MKKKAHDVGAGAPGPVTSAMDETLRLYHAWLGYLIRRLGEETLRVPVGEIRRALEDFSCTVSREGEDYVITLGGAREEAADGGDV